MSVIDRAVDKVGIELDRDVPVPGQRRVRDWAKLIGMARKLESQDSEALEAERSRAASLMEKNLALQSEVFALREQVKDHTLRVRMQEIKLDREDQQILLA